MANIGTLMGFIKLDSSDVRRGVSQSLENLQRLEASFKDLAKVSKLASEFQFDPSRIKQGVTDIGTYLDNLQRRIESSTKGISTFFEKVGADPTDLKNNLAEVSKIIDEMQDSLNSFSELRIAASTDELKGSIKDVKDSFRDVDQASKQTGKALETFGRTKLDTSEMKKQVKDAVSTIGDLEQKLVELSSIKVGVDIAIEKGELKRQIDESTTAVNGLKQKLNELSKVRVSSVVNVEEQIKKGIAHVDTLKQRLTELQKTKPGTQERFDFINLLKKDIDDASLKVAGLKQKLERLNETKPRGSIGVEKQIEQELKNIATLEERLNSLPKVDLLSPQDIKHQIDETTKNIDVFQQRVNKIKGEMKNFEKFNIDTTKANTEINMLGDKIALLDKKIRELRKIDVEGNFDEFNNKVIETQKTFEELQGTVQNTEEELKLLSKSAIGSGTVGEINKEYLKVMKTVSNLKDELKETSKAGGQDFINNAGKMIEKFDKLGNSISNIQNEIAQIGKKDKGIDTSAVQAKFRNLLEHVETLRGKLQVVSNMSLKTDTEGITAKVKDINASLMGMQDRLNTVGKMTKEVISTKTSFSSWAENWHNLTETLAVVSAKFLLIEFALKRMIGLFTSIFRPAYKAVDDFRTSIVQLSSMIVSMQMPDAEELAGAYNKAKGYSEGLLYTLQEIDQQSIATMFDLRNMTEEFIKQGVLLDYMQDSAVEAYKNIANAVAVVAAAYPARETQIRQEIRALLQGHADVRGQLASQLDRAMGGRLKENLKLWKDQKTIVVNLGEYFKGFAAASDDINGLWASISATMTNIRDRIMRGGFVDVYVTINNLLRSMNDYLREHSNQIAGNIYTSWLAVKGAVQGVWFAMQPFVPFVKTFADGLQQVVKELSIISYGTIPVLGDRVNKIMSPAKTNWAIFDVIVGLNADFMMLDNTFSRTRAGLDKIPESFKESGSALKQFFMDFYNYGISTEINSRIDDFNKQISMIGVNYDSVKGSLGRVIAETNKFSDELKEAGTYTTPIKKAFEDYIKLLSDITDKKITFETTKDLLDTISKAGKELEGNINLSLIPSMKIDTKSALDTLMFSFEMMQDELTPLDIPLSVEDAEKTMKEFYGGMQIKSAEWFEFEQSELRKNKLEWDKVAQSKRKSGEKDWLLSQAESDRRYLEQTLTNAYSVLDSITEFSQKKKDIERTITHDTKSELDRRLEDVQVWSEKTEKELKEAFQFKIDPDSLKEFERLKSLLDEETKRRENQAKDNTFFELAESASKYRVELAKAQGATGELGHDEAIYKQIQAYEELVVAAEEYLSTLDRNTSEGEKKWHETIQKIEEAKKATGNLNADIGQFAIRNKEIELDIKIKGIENLQQTFQLSEKDAINQTVAEYEKLLAIQEKVLSERVRFGSDEEWVQYREQVQRTREKLLELQATQLQVSDDLGRGMKAGLMSYINDNQSMFKFGMDSTRAMAEHSAETLAEVFSDFRHGEMESWDQYLGKLAEMILQTMERLLAQMAVAKMLMWAGFGMGGGGGTGGGEAGALDIFGHTGGYVSKNGIAERYHKGGVVGLKSDEVPAILQTGEGILSRKDMMSIGGRTGFQEMRSQSKTKEKGDSYNISVPVNVEGKDNKLASRLRSEIEAVVRRVIKEMV